MDLTQWFKKKSGRKLNRSEFFRMMVDRFNSSGQKITEENESDFFLRREGGGTTHLSNTYERYLAAAPEDEEVTIRSLIEGMRETSNTPDNYEEARGQILPVIRASCYDSLINLTMKRTSSQTEKTSTSVSMELGGGVAVYLVYDTENSMQFIGDDNLQRWGVLFEEAIQQATKNLVSRTSEEALRADERGVIYGTWGDSYESSRILDIDLLERIQVEGELVCFIPSRDQFWLVGSGNQNVVSELIQECETAHFVPYGVLEAPLVLRSGRWEAYIPEDPIAAMAVEKLKVKRADLDYGQQKEELDQLYKHERRDVFVASYFGLETSGFVWSRSVWSRGVPSMLPKTDRIVMMLDSTGGEQFTVNWSDAERIVGHRMAKETTLKPDRYFVPEFPSDRELEELRSVAIS